MKKKGLIVVSIVLTGILIGSVFLFKSLIKESSRSSKPATATLEQLLSLPYVAYPETAQDIEKTGFPAFLANFCHAFPGKLIVGFVRFLTW